MAIDTKDKEGNTPESDRGTFKMGEVSLLLEGTSGISKAPELRAEGRPVRPGLSIAGESMSYAGTSGMSTLATRVASGAPGLQVAPPSSQPGPAGRMATQGGTAQIASGPVGFRQ